jgi:hypothetical protein
METSLQLLMRDGAARIRFHPRLTAEEYAELMVRIVDASTKAELRQLSETFAAKWDKETDFDTQIDRFR